MFKMEKETQAVSEPKQHGIKRLADASDEPKSRELSTKNVSSTNSARTHSITNNSSTDTTQLLLICNKYKTLSDIYLPDIIHMERRSAIIQTFNSLPCMPLNIPVDLSNIVNYRASFSSHNPYNHYIGVILIVTNNSLFQLCQFVQLSPSCIIMPRHAYDMILMADESKSIVLAYANSYLKINFKNFKSGAFEIDDRWFADKIYTDEYVRLLDYQLIKLPMMKVGVTRLIFKSLTEDEEDGRSKKLVRSKHIIFENGDYRLRTLDHSFSSLFTCPGRTIIEPEGKYEPYKYSHTHLPSTNVGTSGGLVFNEDGSPWGIAVAANGSLSCSFLNNLNL